MRNYDISDFSRAFSALQDDFTEALCGPTEGLTEAAQCLRAT